MPKQSIRRGLVLVTLISVSQITAHAQSTTTLDVPVLAFSQTWEAAQTAAPIKGKLFVVTVDHPDRRQDCHVHSFTADKLVCSRAFGGTRTYMPQQIAALIIPGDDNLRVALFLGINGGAGAAIWGTVVLAAACPVCAVATGVAALVLLCAAGAVAYADDQPQRLLYLAPGQLLSSKLGYVEAR